MWMRGVRRKVGRNSRLNTFFKPAVEKKNSTLKTIFQFYLTDSHQWSSNSFACCLSYIRNPIFFTYIIWYVFTCYMVPLWFTSRKFSLIWCAQTTRWMHICIQKNSGKVLKWESLVFDFPPHHGPKKISELRREIMYTKVKTEYTLLYIESTNYSPPKFIVAKD